MDYLKNNTERIKQKAKREDYMDFLRAFGIILMVLGHIGLGAKFDHFIHAFHMPLFFFISGFFFKHKSREELPFWKYLLKKSRSLLLPYILFGLFHFAISWFLSKNHDITRLYHLFFFNNNKLPIASALWFLTALFFANIIYFLIDRYILFKPIKIIVIISISVFGNIVSSFFELPFSLSAAFVGVGLMYLGQLLRQYQSTRVMKFILNLSILPLALLCGVTIVLVFVNGYVNMRTGVYAFIPLFWLNAFLSMIAGINISKLLSKVFSGTVFKTYLLSIGEKSIVYLCLNQLVLKLSVVLTDGEKIAAFALTMFSLYIIAEIVYRTPLKFIVGEKICFKELFLLQSSEE